MRMIFVSLLLISSMGLNSCYFPSNKMSQIETILGSHFIDHILESHALLFYTIVPKQPFSEGSFQKSEVQLTELEQSELKKILISDSSYIFGLTKRALFIPEFAIEFLGDRKIMILFSPSSQQVEVLVEGKNKNPLKVDIDPSFAAIMSIVHKIENEI